MDLIMTPAEQEEIINNKLSKINVSPYKLLSDDLYRFKITIQITTNQND